MYYLEKSEIIFCRKMIVAQCNMKKYKTREWYIIHIYNLVSFQSLLRWEVFDLSLLFYFFELMECVLYCKFHK
jgi:hypothetical protein